MIDEVSLMILPSYECYWILTHLPLDKMAAISQTTFSSAFSWMKKFEFWLTCYWSLFLRVQLTIIQPLSEPMLTRITDAYMGHKGGEFLWWQVNIGSSNGWCRQAAIARANVDPYLCRRIVSLGHNMLQGFLKACGLFRVKLLHIIEINDSILKKSYLSISKIQRCNQWSWQWDKYLQPIPYSGCNHFSMRGSKLNHVSTRIPGVADFVTHAREPCLTLHAPIPCL